MEFKFDSSTVITLDAFMADLEIAMNANLAGQKVKHAKFGEGTISDFKVRADKYNSEFFPSVSAKIDFGTEEKCKLFSVTAMVKSIKNLDPEFGAGPDIIRAHASFDEACEYFSEEATRIEKEIQKALAEKQIKEEAEARAKKAKASYNKMVKADKAKWKEALEKHDTLTDDKLINWLADHIGVIYADVPDYLEKWFAGVFPDARYKVFDSKALTANGYKKKWGLALYASIVGCKDESEYPSEVAQYITNKKLYNTRFLFALCLDHGFKIDAEQDLDSIKEAN